MTGEIVQRPPRQPLVSPGGIDLHERDMTATFCCDLTLAAVQEQLGRIGQWLPIDGDPQQTLGQLVDANSTGPLRLGYGAWRDLLLGAQFYNGCDELITAGGRTVKNVAGYDLTKFMVGQHGVFGRLVTITTRTYRRPAGAILATYPPQSRNLLETSLPPQWVVLTADALLCGYVGDERTLDFYEKQLAATSPTSLATRDLDRDIEHRVSLWSIKAPKAFRASVPPLWVADFALRAKLEGWSADPMFGIVVGPTPADGGEKLAKLAEEWEGSVKFIDRTVDPPRVSFSELFREERAILYRLKDAFDPKRRLRPLPWEDA
jgi:hypothetical protein